MTTSYEQVLDGERRGILVGALAFAASAAIPGTAPAVTPARPVRKSIEMLTSDELRTLEGAIAEMMARSKKDIRDPKGWFMNAESHNEFCAQPGIGGANQIHYCYWFLPWHRAFLAVTERKLREIANDSSLAFPYWNWSAARSIPDRFSRPESPLSASVRYTPKRALADGEVDLFVNDPIKKALVVAALGASKFVANPQTDPVKLARELADSFGGLPRPNALGRFGNSRLEGTPHGPIHNYVGGQDENTGAVGDMGDFETAARDPIFFAHHGNLDRLWENWRGRGSNRELEPKDKTFLSHPFSFPWLDGSTVQVTVAETLDLDSMGYQYDTLEVSQTAPAGEFKLEGFSPKTLPPILQADVALPLTPEAANGAPRRYVLLLEGVRSPRRPLTAGVYVSPASSGGNEVRILVGNISVVPSGGKYSDLDGVLVFDITAAVGVLKTPQLKVLVIPNSLGGEERRPVKALAFRRARVIWT